MIYLARNLCSTSCIPDVCVNIVENEWNAKKFFFPIFYIVDVEVVMGQRKDTSIQNE